MQSFVWISLAFLVVLTACAPNHHPEQSAYNPCGELQKHQLELQRIDEELLSPDATEAQKQEWQTRKSNLLRADERYRRDCRG